MSEQTEQTDLKPEQVEFYSDKLCFLWEQYMKFLGIGIFASGATIAVLLNGAMQGLVTEDVLVVFCIAIISAGVGGLCFLLCRWLSQIVMERQVYADPILAKKYFSLVGSQEPSALRWPERVNKYYRFNNGVKFVAAISLLASWVCGIWTILIKVS
ncbi:MULTISPECIES: hypothetical protein [Thalassospira]|uniref:Uncharacterized protein n=2 Tax=Thalassospira TaxID=168934 RepID=A0A367VZN5_9PROT|nr:MULTISPECIES: hypothetical protein [Thalassospira]MDG4720311.1 hypothetical protein [Thalassospira sp. FZY0004]RCK32196.1 hypothetical protein TH19_19945 [Thalassospira profundimaris]